MASPPPPKDSKRSRLKRFGKEVVQRVLKRPQDDDTPSNDRSSSPDLSVLPGASTAATPPSSPYLSALPETSTVPTRPSSPHPAAVLGPTTVDLLKEIAKVAGNGLETALRLLNESADACPPLKSATSGLVACINLAQAVKGNRQDYEKLATELTAMAEALAPHITELVTEDPSGSITRILLSIDEEVKDIGEKRDRGRMMRIIEANQDTGDVIQRYRRIESLFRQLQNDVTLRTLHGVQKMSKTMLLDRLSPVHDALYNSSYSTTIKRGGCTAETREKILEELKNWVEDLNGAKVYWTNGMGGTGKTTIMYSLCEWLAEMRRLGGNFFCSRMSALCRDVNNIIPTLAFQLAQYSPAFRTALCKVLEEEPQTSKLDVRWQFEKLVQGPMQAVAGAMPDGVVVVIDALDECDDGQAFRMFLDTLLKLAVNLPIKFLVTSRPEPTIRDKMLAPGYSPSVLQLHDIEASIVEADIKKYLKAALGSMSPLPSPDEVEQLTMRAGKLFIYAATAVRYIDPDDPRVDSIARLRVVLGREYGSPKQYEVVDELYTGVLSAAFHPKLEHWETQAIQRTLWTAICAKEPMTAQTLASLLCLAENIVRTALHPLRSVLHVQEGTGLVSAFHASFPDYILDHLRSGKFYCDKAAHSQVLIHGCFDVMKANLRFNICNLESPFLFDKDVVGLAAKIQKLVTAALTYACQYWGEHLRDGDFSNAVHDKLVDFLTHRLLFWMEILNLKRCMEIGVEILRRVQKWLLSSLFNTRKLASDAEAFVMRFAAGACNRSTPHIYISGLPFCRKSSTVYKNYWGHTQGLIDVKGSVMEQWQSTDIGIWTTSSAVTSLAFTSDGNHIISGSNDHTIQVWDSFTGNAVAGPFEGHTALVSSVSSNGNRIVSGSYDHTIRIWDSRTGNAIAGPFEGHIAPVASVAFSPNGNYIVSGSYDHTIQVWDSYTGNAVTGPLKGHTDWVVSVSFSSDGNHIVSGSDDQTIRVWDSHTGNAVAGPFIGHLGQVKSVAFTPDGNHIVSGSNDCTIRVWDSSTGKVVAGPFKGHTASITSIAFSSDGSHIVSGSDDHTIRVWDSSTGKIVAGPFIGHTDSVTSVAFSPDNKHVASGSYDHTIRVWESHTSNAIASPIEGHTDQITTIAFSPDGNYIVSGSRDLTIRVWDSRSGNAIAGPFKGHEARITSVVFSPDGSRVISGSYDRTIRIWDSSTGSTSPLLLIRHKSQIKSVAFTPDGNHIVCGSNDGTILVWNSFTGKVIAGPFRGHTGPITSVAFSPNGNHIVSGSCDHTIRVWDSFM